MKHLICALLLGGTAVAVAGPDYPLEGRVTTTDLQAFDFSIKLDRVAPVKLFCEELGGNQERHIVAAGPAAHHQLTVRGLKADTEYVCHGELLDGSRRRTNEVTIQTASLPSDLAIPEITVHSSNVAQTGYTLFNYGVLTETADYDSNYLVILDADGAVRWYRGNAGGGDIDATYLGHDEILFGGHGANFGPPPHYIPPTVVGLDKEIKFVGTRQLGSPFETAGSYNHDVGISEDGDSIFSLVYTIIDKKWRGFAVKEIDLDNNIRWVWDSVLDGVDEGLLEPGNDENNDPYHPNTVWDRWENGRLYIYLNLRNLQQVLKIDYLTRDVVWKLGMGGDFTLLEPDGSLAAPHRWFFHQHDIKMIGNQLVVYDNGTGRSELGASNDFSRAMRLEVDEQAMTARISFEYAEPGWFEPIWGGLDWLDSGNMLIASGHFWLADTQSIYSTILEVSPQGVPVWRAEFAHEADSIYRADRISGCEAFSNARFCPELDR